MSFLDGLWDLPAWGVVLYTLVMVQITIAAVTLYLHRCQAHMGLTLHPVVSHFFRFWLWLTTGMSTREWVAVHRKHHARCETEDDPHSPRIFGIRKVFFEGAELYRKAAADPETIARYSHGTPNDWLENHLYTGPASSLGVALMALVNIALFGPIGLTVWAVQMIWIPLHAAGGINGIGHYWGYRNFETDDDATNMWPIAFWIGGEELHNNHHAFPSSAKFSVKPWEFDIGWLYIRILSALKLAKVRSVAPVPVIEPAAAKDTVDLDTVRAVARARLHLMAHYADTVIKPVWREELRRARGAGRDLLRRARKALLWSRERLQPSMHEALERTLEISDGVRTVYQQRERLREIWARSYASQEALVQAVADWCREAEQSGIEALQRFAASLRGLRLQPAAA
ncbi:MAG: aminotransferase [Gammaproteobacteria bacterium]|nr:MAG: aminotransferase [Gammaproteobacteria bacterium]